MMNICITGFGWSGSGAVHDLIREYDDVQIIKLKNGDDFEFYLLHDHDGIRTLDLLLTQVNNRYFSYIPIKRFEKMIHSYAKYMYYEEVFKGHFLELSSKYISDIVDFNMSACTFYEQMFPSNFDILERKLRLFISKLQGFFLKLGFKKAKKRISIYKPTDMKVSYNPKNFMEATKQYMSSLINLISDGSGRPIVFDQIFPPDTPDQYFKYVPDTKTIVVIRDPRDTYLLMKCAYSNYKLPIPIDNVKEFISFYKKTIFDVCNIENENLMYVHYEDLIYHYETTKIKIEKFLNISQHTHPLEFFNPAISINNTQLFKKYTEYKNDIMEIERAIPEALYMFDKNIEHNNKIIY